VRVRLSSIEATEVTRELIEVMKDFSSQVCPHLHVCLQSGSDKILRGMKRRWTRRHIIDRCQLVKSELHLPAFTTDVIVGFPGETEDDFADTIDACRQIGFSKIHMFPFSPRKGTPAAEMEEQIPKKIKSERGAKIAALEKELKREYFENLVGEQLQLLVENVNDDNSVTGTSCRYATVNAIAPEAKENELITVQVETAGDILFGRAI
jgi:threonylcarbamoyladenosine tRNA methylthiotransferase MtaB